MRSDRRAAVAALAVLTLAFLAGGALLGEVFGSSGDSDQTFIDRYGSSQNRVFDIAGSALLIVSGGALLVFVAAMRRLLKPVDSLTADLFSLSGAVVAILLMVAGTLFLTTPFSISFGGAYDDKGQFGGGHAAVLPQAGTFMVAFAAMPLAAFVVVLLNLANRRVALFPRWHTALAWACATLLLLSLTGGALVALPTWSAATAVALWRGRRLTAATEETVAAPGSS